jgi:hypothetical protein
MCLGIKSDPLVCEIDESLPCLPLCLYSIYVTAPAWRRDEVHHGARYDHLIEGLTVTFE